MKYRIILPALLLLTACSQAEPDGGALPMVFTATIREAEPQSRIFENGDHSNWNVGDIFKVRVTNGDRTMETSCTIIGTGFIGQYDPPLYWNSIEKADVSAWYSNITGQSTMTDNTVSLADQSRGLAYVLRATATAEYDSSIKPIPPIPLEFHHQLAKIIVIVNGECAPLVKSVKINNYTSCTIDEGIVSPDPDTQGLITMKRVRNGRFEAALVPVASITPSDFISIDIDKAIGNPLKVEINGIDALEAGKVYTITINADFKEDPFNGRIDDAVLMREASDDKPALYFATCNIGADAPEQAGLYFWWGDIEGHKFDAGFNFYGDNDIIATKGQTIGQLLGTGYIDNNMNLTPAHDAARQHWGGRWRMPTKDDIEWLVNSENCTRTWQEPPAGPAGYFVRSNSTENQIFLPAVGYYLNTQLEDNGNRACCWLSTADDNSDDRAFTLNLISKLSGSSQFPRYYGFPVRPVLSN